MFFFLGTNNPLEALSSASENMFSRSLFFTEAEEEAIHKRKQAQSFVPSSQKIRKKHEASLPAGIVLLSLNGLLFSSPHSWFLWMNQGCLSSDDQQSTALLDGLEVQSVCVDHVVFRYKKSAGEKEIIFTLRPGQTYSFSTGKIWYKG